MTRMQKGILAINITITICLLIITIMGIYQWTIADEVVNNAVCITLLILGPLTIINIRSIEQLEEKLSRLEKEVEKDEP